MILDRRFAGDSKILRIAKDALRAGASFLQLRDKSAPSGAIIPIARKIKKMASQYKIPFIINDRLDVAIAADADGLHIGRGDIDISLARRVMGRGRIIGRSAASFSDVATAKRNGADYIGVGPVFRTPLKNGVRAKGPDFLKRIKARGIPFFAIGGIGLKNIYKLTRRGVKNIAVIRAISKARDPYTAAMRLKKAIA